MAITIEGLELDLQQNTSEAVSGIDNLIAAMNRLKDACGVLGDLRGVARAIKDIARSANGDFSSGFRTMASEARSATREVSEMSRALAQVKNFYTGFTTQGYSGTVEGGRPRLEDSSAAWKDKVIIPGTYEEVKEGADSVKALTDNMRLLTDATNSASSAQNGFQSEMKENVDADAAWREQIKARQAERRAAREAKRSQAPAADPVLAAAKQNAAQAQAEMQASIAKAAAAQQAADAAKASLASVGAETAKVSAGGVALKALGGAFAVTATAAVGFSRAALKAADSVKKRLVGAIKGAMAPIMNLGKAIARVGLNKAIRGMISIVNKGIQEGIQNFYQYSAVIGGPFKGTMDGLASSFQYLKNSIGAAAAPLISALAPAINVAISAVVTLINALNQLFSLLGGALSWTKAAKAPKEFAESAKGAGGAAGKAAKDMKNFVMGFDELNMIQQNDSGGGGGGGGASAEDYALMFEKAEYADWAKLMKEKIEMGDWEGAGRVLGNKVNEIIDSFDAEAFGQRMATKLNHGIQFAFGFLDQVNFTNIGRKFAQIANQIFDPDQVDWTMAGQLWGKKITIFLDMISGFIKTFDFENFGTSVTNFLIGWGTEVGSRLNEAARTINTAIEGIATAMNTVLDGIDWSSAGGKIAEAFNRIDWSMVVSSIGNTLLNVMSSAFQFASGFIETVDWQKFGSDMIEGLSNINWNEVADSFWELFGAAVGAVGGALWGAVKKIGENLKSGWDEYMAPYTDECGNLTLMGILNGMVDAIGDIFGWLYDHVVKPFFSGLILAFTDGTSQDEDPRKIGEDIINGICAGIDAALIAIGTWIKEHIFDPIVNGIKAAFGIASPAEEMKPLGENIVDGIKEGISNAWHNITDFFKEKLESIKVTIRQAWDDVKEWTRQKWELIKKHVIDPVLEFKKEIEDKFAEIKKNVEETWENIRKWTEEKWQAIKDAIPEPVKNIVGEIGKVVEKAGEYQKAWEDAKNGFTTYIGEMGTAISNFATNAIRDIDDTLAKIRELDHESPEGGLYGTYIDETGIGYSGPRAEGGFPTEGQLFLAREAGPEMVGTIGGNTAVANNDQIVAGITSGVASANQNVVAAIYQLISAVNSKDMSVNISDGAIGRSYDRYSQSRGVRVNSGAFANAY